MIWPSFLIRQIHVSLPFLSRRCLSSHTVLLQPSSVRATNPWASSAVASLESRYSTHRPTYDGSVSQFTEQMELVPAEVEGIIQPCIKLAGRIHSSYMNTVRVRVCEIVDVDATIATNTSSLTQPSFSGDIVDLSS